MVIVDRNFPARMSEGSSKNTIMAIAAIVILVAITWVWTGGFAAPSIEPGKELPFIGAGVVTVALAVGIYYMYKRM